MTPDGLNPFEHFMQTLHTPLISQFLLCLCAVLVLAACTTPPAYLSDSDVIPIGSRLNFWVDHDKHGWIESNIHIAYLPRIMTGGEARRWAEAVGQRDAGLRWTHYYLLVTHPDPSHHQYRTPVYTRARSMPQFSK
jgi:hypothetical protein